MTKKAIAPTSVTQRAMLVDLSITYWVTHKKDRKVADEVAVLKHAEHDAGAWWTALVPPKALSAVMSARARARAYHFEKTLPWCNDGARILPASMFFEYTQEMRKREAEYKAAVEDLLKDYPALVEQAKKRLGSMWKAEHYPHVAAVRSKFRWAVVVNPLPQASDFRVDLGAEATEQVKASIEEHTKEALTSAMTDLWERMYEVITHLSEKMKEEKGIFRDSIVGNIKDLCDLLPKMNVLEDPNLEAMRQTILKSLCSQKPEDLRISSKQRKAAATTADDILKKMESFMGRKA